MSLLVKLIVFRSGPPWSFIALNLKSVNSEKPNAGQQEFLRFYIHEIRRKNGSDRWHLDAAQSTFLVVPFANRPCFEIDFQKYSFKTSYYHVNPFRISHHFLQVHHISMAQRTHYAHFIPPNYIVGDFVTLPVSINYLHREWKPYLEISLGSSC